MYQTVLPCRGFLSLQRCSDTKDGVRIGNWIYWILMGRNYIIAALHNVQLLNIILFRLSALVFQDLSHRNYNSLTELDYKYYTLIKSSNHILILHRMISNSSALLVSIHSSSPVNFSWLSPTEN
jgi:hypothetical protein